MTSLSQKNLFSVVVLVGIFFSVLLSPAFAATSPTSQGEVSGWIPFWRAEQGAKDALRNIKAIDTLFPFAFTVKNDGSLKDLAGLKDRHWQNLFKEARKRHVEIVPSITSSDGDLTQQILGDAERRTAHIEEIVSMVKKGKYDGVDIDYEDKHASTKVFFSLFLKELKTALGSKILSCTIEPRTPPDSLYKDIPAVLEYSNDYVEIAKYCDRVQIMAYDQQRADLRLNASKAGQPYMPLADLDWVRKVVAYALLTIPKEKIVLGVPTYGHHYEVTVSPDWYQNYTRIGALNIPDMLDVAKKYKVKPSRNRAGEMSFSYLHASSTVQFPSSLQIPKDTTSGNFVAAEALAYANKTGETLTFRIASWSDSTAIETKKKLAEEFHLKGIALFKIDGEEDRNIWKFLK